MDSDPSGANEDRYTDDELTVARGGISDGGVIGTVTGGTATVPVVVAVNEGANHTSAPVPASTAATEGAGSDSGTQVSGGDDYLGGGYYEQPNILEPNWSTTSTDGSGLTDWESVEEEAEGI